ncbi:MAG TPA: hypothetical protein VKA95_04390 [Nitrososphaeraceae archaeon]|nr:hypothetical protein [Nitrososphaeraceae archaeon]
MTASIMESHRCLTMFVTLAGILMVTGIIMLSNNSLVQAQLGSNRATACNNNQCQTMVCPENQSCYITTTPNTPDTGLEDDDVLDDIEDMFDTD